jgi:trimethylamine--corrinoid protein Co-methyltransferase
MRLSPAFLSEGDRERVHHESLRILADVGVRYHGQRALPLLEKAGAGVDDGTGVARIPAGLVAEALAAAPGSFVLGARNTEHDFAVPSPVTRYAIDGTASFVTDSETGERRYGTKRDIVDALRVFRRPPVRSTGSTSCTPRRRSRTWRRAWRRSRGARMRSGSATPTP